MTPASQPALTTPPSTAVAELSPEQERINAFCSADNHDIFHSIVSHHEIWKADPFDVESIHREARDAFLHLVNRAATAPDWPAGRIQLLLGESGSGKTHLMRAFRNYVHEKELGYCGYLQMTSLTTNYGRYVLRSLIEALDQPYLDPEIQASGLARLSQAVLDAVPGISPLQRAELRDVHMDSNELASKIAQYADQTLADPRFSQIDLSLLRVLLYLQRKDPRIKSRVLKYLRCEDLAPADRQMLGHIEPRIHEEDPLQMIVLLGQAMWSAQSMVLVLCVDQLEDTVDQDATNDQGRSRFRRAIDTLCAITDKVPSSVVVVSCLQDYFDALRSCLSQPKLDRLEKLTTPIRLTSQRNATEVEALIGRRLQQLYEQHEVPIDQASPTFPLPAELVESLTNQRARDVLSRCRTFREACQNARKIAAFEPSPSKVPPPPVASSLERDWNDFRTAFAETLPDEEEQLAALLRWAVEACSQELTSGHWFAAEANGRTVPVEHHGLDNAVDRLLIGICNKGAQGGGLGRQIEEVIRLAGENRLVVVRSSEFTKNPKAKVANQIGDLIKRGGRRVVIEDSDWRTMQALRAFRGHQERRPEYQSWLQDNRPLSRLPSLQAVMDLERLTANRPFVSTSTAPQPPAATSTGPESSSKPVTPKPTSAQPATHSTVADSGPILVGKARNLKGSDVTLDPQLLTRHAAFLGGTGSGKTTAALNLIEQLLLRGIPAVLVDRKGDLCGYADPTRWSQTLGNLDAEARRQRLRGRLDVALYTPGHPAGRPLAIQIVPDGIDQLTEFDRDQLAGFAASSLAGMMGYSPKSRKDRVAILRQAIGVLGGQPDSSVTVARLIEFINSEDPLLLEAVGVLDVKLFNRLAQDLQTLWLSHRELLTGGEQLEMDALLGTGAHAKPGRVRLSVISTKFLGDNANVEFWVTQLLLAIMRWASKNSKEQLQAVFLFDEADLYLPATRQPATKAPMENLLKRARSAGLGVLLGTQSPGDLDYRCRENIITWVLGAIKENTAMEKLKPLWSECREDVASRLPKQEVGQFYLIRGKEITSVASQQSLLATQQLPEDRILELARTIRTP